MKTQMSAIIEQVKTNINTNTQKEIQRVFEEIINDDVWSLTKDEYEKMNRDEKREVIKSIKKAIDESKVETSDEVVEENETDDEQSEVQQLIQDEIEQLNRVKDKLNNRLANVNGRLRELTGESKVTKMDMCRDIYKTNPNLARKDYIKLFMEQANCTQAGASTYLVNIKKEQQY